MNGALSSTYLPPPPARKIKKWSAGETTTIGESGLTSLLHEPRKPLHQVRSQNTHVLRGRSVLLCAHLVHPLGYFFSSAKSPHDNIELRQERAVTQELRLRKTLTTYVFALVSL